MLPGDIVDRFPCRVPLFRFVRIIVAHRNLLLAPRLEILEHLLCPAFAYESTQFRAASSFSYTSPLLAASYLLQRIVHGLLADDDDQLFPSTPRKNVTSALFTSTEHVTLITHVIVERGEIKK